MPQQKLKGVDQEEDVHAYSLRTLNKRALRKSI